jgi:hypothetical protein
MLLQGTFVGGLVVGFYFNWKLTLVILAFMPLMGISGAMMKVRPCLASTIQCSSPLSCVCVCPLLEAIAVTLSP